MPCHVQLRIVFDFVQQNRDLTMISRFFEMVTGISQRRTASPDDSHRQERANSARVTAKGAKPQESELSQTVC